MSKKQATMRDVAKLAGVTQPTVSYVINGTANISEEVRAKVLHAIAELDYKPNYYARALKTKRTNMIGVILPDISNEYYSSIVNCLELLLQKENCTLLINSTNYKKETEEKIIQQLLSYHAQGIIVTYQLENSSCWSLLKNSGIPVVVLEGGSPSPALPCINTDNHLGGYLATNYLLKQGRRHIAYIGQNAYSSALSERLQGYKDAMSEYGLFDSSLIYETDGPQDKWKEGVLLGKQLVDSSIDGIVVSSDIIAVGIIKTLIQAGRHIPKDISLIGYDDIPLAQLFLPALSTVAQPIDELCRLAVASILGDNCTQELLLTPTLVLRDTT